MDHGKFIVNQSQSIWCRAVRNQYIMGIVPSTLTLVGSLSRYCLMSVDKQIWRKACENACIPCISLSALRFFWLHCGRVLARSGQDLTSAACPGGPPHRRGAPQTPRRLARPGNTVSWKDLGVQQIQFLPKCTKGV